MHHVTKSWIKDLYKVSDSSLDFKVTECEKWIVMISCFTLQLNVEKLLVKFWYISKNIRSYLKRSTKILLSTYLYRAGISYASLKTITNN